MFTGSVYRLLCWHKQRRQRCKVISNYPGIWQCCSLLISCTRPNDSADVLHLLQFRYQPWTGIRSLRLQLSSHLLAHDSPHIPRQTDKHQWRLHLQYFSNFSKTETNRICPVALTAVPKSTDSAFYLPQDGEISISCTHPFNGPLELPGSAGTRKVKPIWILLKQETVASAGPYASLHLTPDRYPCQYPTTQFFTGRILPFLPPNQQRQSTEGRLYQLCSWILIINGDTEYGRQENTGVAIVYANNRGLRASDWRHCVVVRRRIRYTVSYITLFHHKLVDNKKMREKKTLK